MKKLIIVVLIAISTNLFAQDKKDFKPSGKVSAKIFMNVHSGIGTENKYQGFELNRAYLGYKYTFAKGLSGKITLDVGNPSNGSKLEQTAYLKAAMLNWKEGNLSVDFGLIGTKQFKTQEKFWGYRYLFKSFQDEHKFGSSADMGLSATYKFSKQISADIIILNGEGYKKIQKDNNYKTGLGLTVNPIKEITFRAYAETYSKPDENEDAKDQTAIALFAGYKDKVFSLGTEYNMTNNYKFTEDNKLTGLSIYSTYKMCKRMKVLARFDQLSSKDDWNENKDGNMILAGLEYSPIKNLKIAPNYRVWNPKEDGEDNKSYIYINLQLAF